MPIPAFAPVESPLLPEVVLGIDVILGMILGVTLEVAEAGAWLLDAIEDLDAEAFALLVCARRLMIFSFVVCH